jgi:hypothetical protein
MKSKSRSDFTCVTYRNRRDPDNVELPRSPAGLAYFCWLILPCHCRGGRHLAGKLNEQRPADRKVKDGKPDQSYLDPAKYLADNLRADFMFYYENFLSRIKVLHTLPAPFTVHHELIDLASFTRHTAYFAARRSFLDRESPHHLHE